MPKVKFLTDVFDRGAVIYRKNSEVEIDPADAERALRRGWATAAEASADAAPAESKTGKGKKSGD